MPYCCATVSKSLIRQSRGWHRIRSNVFTRLFIAHIVHIQYRITSTTLMTQQWLRKVSLILGDEDGEALNMSELRVAFSVQGGVVLTPKHADILILTSRRTPRSAFRKNLGASSCKQAMRTMQA